MTLLTAVSTILAGCGLTMDKYDWRANESAPEGYPMEVVSGSFYFANNKGSLYVPPYKTVQNGWGHGVSIHVTGADTKPLPNRLYLRFFSYTENQYYEGDFALPYDTISQLFKKGYYSQADKGDVTYSEITAGMAPGGGVAVWLNGLDKRTAVFYGYADKVDSKWGELSGDSDLTRQEFVDFMLDNHIKEAGREKLAEDGIPYGLWEKYYKQRYYWLPVFKGPNPPEIFIRLKYFNGEHDFLYPLGDGATPTEARAVPRYIEFRWRSPNERNYIFELNFDEQEIYEAFEKISINNSPLQLEMRVEWEGKKGSMTYFLTNGDTEIQLNKTYANILQ